jgi:hypothetical protein
MHIRWLLMGEVRSTLSVPAADEPLSMAIPVGETRVSVLPRSRQYASALSSGQRPPTLITWDVADMPFYPGEGGGFDNMLGNYQVAT